MFKIPFSNVEIHKLCFTPLRHVTSLVLESYFLTVYVRIFARSFNFQEGNYLNPTSRQLKVGSGSISTRNKPDPPYLFSRLRWPAFIFCSTHCIAAKTSSSLTTYLLTIEIQTVRQSPALAKTGKKHSRMKEAVVQNE
jgi:hypothetical protein